ncbi:MAG: hypothetical protein M3Z33_06910 [Actinomycetota bacterium]|nr:hypothetical protein [Actinomycetota bacterium]
MTPPQEPSERELADLAALADGSLASARREAVQARVSSSPELRALAAEQQRAVDTVRAVAGPAPASLRERIGDQRRHGAHHARRGRLRLATGLGGALAAAVVVLVLLLPGGAPGGPTIVQAAGLTMRGPSALAPTRSDGSRRVSTAVDGIAFPYWGDAFGWEASGARSDRLGGRRATTVFYDKAHQRIGYTIVSGTALAVPRGVRADMRQGIAFRSFRRGTGLILTWRRAGHTCVLTGERVPLESLLALAAWR